MEKLTANFGFKGERGYSAYEIAVQNGYEGSEQDWLATLGTSSHFSQDSAVYEGDGEKTQFDLPGTYTSDSFVAVYVDGAKINDTDGYTLSNNKVVFSSAVENGKEVEIILSSMSTNSLPIVTTINSESTNDTAAGAKAVYDSVLTPLTTTITANKSDADDKISALTTRMTAAETAIGGKQSTVLYGTTDPDNSVGENGDIYLQYKA